MGAILAPALVLFHLVDDVLRNAQLLARGQYRLDLFARLKPYSVFPREYFRYGEALIPAGQRELEGFVRNDLLNLLMLRVCEVYL